MRGKDLLRELQRTVDELAVLNEIGKALTSSLDIGEVLHVILAKVSELLKPRHWALFLVESTTGELVCHSAVGAESESLPGRRVLPGEGLAAWVAEHNQPALVPDASRDPRVSRSDVSPPGLDGERRSILCVPMAFKDRVLGVIELANGKEEGEFDREAQRILTTVAEFSAIALENARNFHKVQELTVLDDHTGLFNSRHLKRVLDGEIARATRFGHPVSLIFFDLDHFKRVNDSHGHQAGSQVLHEVGKLLLRTLRSTDVPVRYGGDEFVVLLPETSKDQALEAARRIANAIAQEPFLPTEPYGPLRVTASIGLAAFPDDAQAPEQLLRRADQAMYQAKAIQRGSVASAGSPAASLPVAAPTPGLPPGAPAPATPGPERNGSLTGLVSSEP